MRRLLLILGLVLIVAMTIREFYDFIVTNEGIRYFSSDPMRLAYVVSLCVAGGIVAFGISRLSRVSQRKLKLLALGGFGIFLVGGAVFTGYFFYSFRTAPLVYDGGAWGWVLAGCLSAASAAGLVWWEFSRVWRQTR